MSLSASSLAQELKTQALANAQRSGSEGDALAALEAANFPCLLYTSPRPRYYA